MYSSAVGLYLCLAKTNWQEEVRRVVERMEKEKADEMRRRHGTGQDDVA